jgi:polysaccharide biosynthesis PFTS motif protein
MDPLNNSSNVTKVKYLVKNQLKGLYPPNIADLLVDRRFSKIPMNLRFTTNDSQNEKQQELMLKEMSHTKISIKELIREFSFVVFLLFSLVLAFIFNRSKNQNSRMYPSYVYSLTPEQILNNGSTDLLREFLREPRFQKLFLRSYLVVESKQVYRFLGKNTYKDLEVVFDTSIWIAKNQLSRKMVLSVLHKSISRFVRVLKERKKDELQILREHVIDEPLWRIYLQSTQNINPINVVTTQSQFLRLPYAFYTGSTGRIVRSMLWYSTNSIAIQNIGTQAKFDPDHFRLENIDNHFVWTTEHKKSLIRHNPNAEVLVVGSILFIPSQSTIRNNGSTNTDIVIFDVTPFNGHKVEVFYSSEILIDFIQDITDVLSLYNKTKSSRILLKPKREYRRKLRGGFSLSIQYMDLLSKLQKSNIIEVLRADVNLYDLVGQSKLVIGIPFTSPVILAKELKVPSVYYVPESASNWLISKTQDGVTVLKGKSQLESFIQDL